MKLFLTSAGMVPETKTGFLQLLPKKPEYMRVAFIPTAANPEQDRWYLNKSKLRFAELGIVMINEVDLEHETKDTLAPKLANADVIYVEGGNTYYLMKYVRASGFAVLVKDFLERGGVYVGSSAGSIIAGPTIETSRDQNTVALDGSSGLGLVPFAIKPHVDETNIAAAKENAAKLNYPVVALADHQAVIVDGARTEIVGPGETITFGQVDL
jgi:dipeptidase E